MSSFIIESQLVVQTAAAWAADSTVYADKRMLIVSNQFWPGTSDARKFKIADGVQEFSDIEFPPIGAGQDSLAITFFTTTNANLADNSVYFIGQGVTMSTNIIIPTFAPFPAGTITRVMINTYVAGTFGSSEAGTLNFFSNDEATDDEITDAMLFNDRDTFLDVPGLNITTETGNAYFKFTAPVYATNPTGVRVAITVFIIPD